MSRVFHVTESKMENEDEYDELCIASAVVVAVVARKKRRRPRSCWVRQWLLNRPQHGIYATLMSMVRSSDPSAYQYFCRMAPEDYDQLLNMIRTAVLRSS